ncbi:serine hydrolase domain-containing protein [Saccharicrinis sp. FJH2]|uniref:serine hydrolase domain-containing protein n=1 Tax=Saccharicrinis sp. FJH65 TaxID=3344659 RepID=UPI0035F4341B
MMIAKKPFITVLFLILATIVQAQDENHFQERLIKLDTALCQRIRESDAGASIIITHKAQIIFEKYLGYANFEKEEKLNSDHVLGIASMSKQFLGMATLILANEGKIDLDREIKDYLPDLPLDNRHIKIKQLLSHTSGLPELTQSDEFMSKISEKHTVNEIINIGLKGKYRSEPGEKYMYCNTGYTIMTALIEQQSGMNFSDFLNEKIFVPLAMNHTYSCDYNHDATNAVQRYSLDSTGYHHANIMHFSNLIGGGGMVSNVRDMAQWNMALVSGRSLPPNYTDIWKPVLLNSGESTGYGLGMGVSSYKGRTFYYHPGMGDGMNAINLIFPSEEITITVIRNVFPPRVSSNEIALLAADFLFED